MTEDDNEGGNGSNGSSARIPCTDTTRDTVRALKRGDETYDDLLLKMADQYNPDGTMDEYDVPLMTPDGDGWDETVRAEGPRHAIQIATARADGDGVMVASAFLRDHLNIDTAVAGENR